MDPAANTTYRASRTSASPLVLDLDGDGVEVTQLVTGARSQILFDHDADGVRTGTAWAKSDDGILTLDRNGNGTIDSGRELFGNNTVTSSGQKAIDGYAALADLDSNGDGQITSLDQKFNDLRVWRDLDQDGVSDTGELSSLADLGVTRIGLTQTASSQTLADGTKLDGTGSFTIDGQSRTYTDAWFAENAFYREFTTAVTLTDAAKTMPGMQGSGMVRDLREAASLDATLVSDVNGLTGLSRTEMMVQLDTLLQHWAGTSTMKTSFQRAHDNGYTLVYLPHGMSVDAHFAESGVFYSNGGGYYSYPSEFLDPLKEKQRRIEKLIGILERFNGQTFVDVGETGIKSGTGATYGSATVSTGSTGGGGVSMTSGEKYVFFTITEPNQYKLLEESYAQLKESIYGGLVLETRLKPYLDQVTLNIDESGISLDYSAMVAALDSLHGTDAVRAFIDTMDLNSYGQGLGWNSAQKLIDWANEANASGQMEALKAGLAAAYAESPGGAVPDIKFGTSGNDNLSTGAGNDLLIGGAGNDHLYGYAGNDILDGGAGNDYLTGGNGADTYLFGTGSGQDTIYNNDSDAVGVNADTIQLGTGLTPSNVTLSRSGDDLLVSLTGTTDMLRVQSYFSQDGASAYAVENLKFADGTVWNVATVKAKVQISTSGNDTLHGYAGADTLSGGDGNDYFYGKAGNDVLDGGNGNDYLHGEDGDDSLSGGAGADYLSGGNGNDLLTGGSENDTLYGNDGNDVLEGGDGNDYIYDTAGTAFFNGGAGIDTLTGGASAELYLGGTGNDTLTTAGGNDVICFNKGDGQDIFATGGTGSDTVSLGGAFAYSDLTFSKSSSDLVLKMGASDQITFKNWYAATPSKPVVNLQVIAEAMAGFDAGGSDALLDQKVENFNFSGLVGAFDAARAANPTLTSWALANALATCNLGGSDTAALGGDLAYQYGKNGTLAGIGLTAAQDVIGASGFGTQAQTLRPLESLQTGAVRLS